MSLELQISGMTCDACAQQVRDALQQAGARAVEVDWRAGWATVEADGASTVALAGALEGTNYRVQHIVEPAGPEEENAGEFEYDLAIIGSGGGAFAAAIAARRRELRVVMIERGVVGGTCVNVGCIPSKAMLAAAESRHRAAHGRFSGINTDAGPVDLVALVAAKDDIVGELRQHKYIELAGEYGFEIIEGDARFVDGPAVEVDGHRVEAAHYLVATGAEPHVPDVPGLTDSGYLTSTTAMELEELPTSMIVVGGGYVAMEQAQLFAHLGVEVTMLVRSRIARGEEPEVSDTIREAFEAEGIRVHEGTTPERVARAGDEVVVWAPGREVRAEHLLVATGRRPRTAGLGLEDVGVRVGERGEMVVDDDLSTATRACGAPGTSPATRSSSTSPRSTVRWLSRTPSSVRSGASTTRRSRASRSPIRRSPRRD